MIKALFFDIDGTLVSFKTHTIAASTMEALRNLRAKGIKVFIATGRQLQCIDNLGDLEVDGYITLNGGYCIAGSEDVIYKHAIPQEDIHSMLEYQRTEHSFPCACVTEDKIVLNYRNESVDALYEQIRLKAPEIGSIEALADKEIFQLIAFFTAEEEERIMAYMPNSLAARWSPYFADVVAKGCTKAVGIDRIIEHYGISLKETMAFGDGGNDIAMLQHAGVGVAMGNAMDEVKEAADFVTTSVDEDGIVNALRHFGLL